MVSEKGSLSAHFVLVLLVLVASQIIDGQKTGIFGGGGDKETTENPETTPATKAAAPSGPGNCCR